MDPMVAAKNALEMVLDAEPGETVLIIADEERADVAEAFAAGAVRLGLWCRLIVLPEPDANRAELDASLKAAVASSDADIMMNFLRGVAEETPFRIALVRLQTRKRRRLVHCPGTSLDMLERGALALSREEYDEMQGRARALMDLLEGAKTVNIRNAAGTDVTVDVSGRRFHTDTKVDWKTLKWMNLPVGEVIVGPNERKGSGVIACDVAVGGVGPISVPIKVPIKDGRAGSVFSKDPKLMDRVVKNISADDMARHVGEFAFGLNFRARNVEQFVETEKIGGTVHIALGNNEDYPGGGENHSSNHMDFLMSEPTVTVVYEDGTSRVLMKAGKFQI